MSDAESVSLKTELATDDAVQEIAKAVTGRRAFARRYVRWIRRRHPEATPAEVIAMLERHYAGSITTAGAAIAVGTIAADVGIGLIPVAGGVAAGVKSAGQQAAKHTGKQVAKQAAKRLALSAGKAGAQRATGLIPAGDQQLQFEITAIFGLAIAEIHGIEYDRDQAQALVFGLTNDRVSQQQIATMAKDVAQISPDATSSALAVTDGETKKDWASTLANALPGGAAKTLVMTMQTGQLDDLRENLSGKQQASIDYGVSAVAGGITRFVFGREVISSARSAFPEPPTSFPDSLAVAPKSDPEDSDSGSSTAFDALQDAARSTGSWVAAAGKSVGGGVAGAAGAVAQRFRSVDLDGDGVADEPQALTAAKNVGGAVSGAADAVASNVVGLFKRRRRVAEDDANADLTAEED
jgi:hypothetical protein